MTKKFNADYNWHRGQFITSSNLEITSGETVDKLLMMFTSGDPNNQSLLPRLFSVTFIEYDDYVSFFERILIPQNPPIPLMMELTNIEMLSVYLEDENLNEHPMVRFLKSGESPLYSIFLYENFSEDPKFPINAWRWLDYFLDDANPKKFFPSDGGYWSGEIIKHALFYGSMQSDIEAESDTFEQYLERVIEKLGPRRDVLYSFTCFQRRQAGQSLKEISELDAWDGY